MSNKDSIVLRGNSEALYIWPIWVLAIAFGILNTYLDDVADSSGVIFICVTLPSITTSLVRLRGLWSLVVTLIVLVLALFSKIIIDFIPPSFAEYIYSTVPEKIASLAVKITPDIYFMIGIPLMLISFLSYMFECRKSVTVTNKEIIVQGLYKGKQTYESKNADFKERRRDWFRYLFGFYAGDLEISISHGNQYERIEIKNLTHIKEKMAMIHRLKNS